MRKKKPSETTRWHALSAAELCRRLGVTEQGLGRDEVERRLARYGRNRLTPPARRGPIRRLLMQFHNVLIYVLLVAAGVTAAIEHWVDSGVILGVVLLTQ